MDTKLKLLEIYGDEYKLKHEHLWKIYFKFVYALISILGLFILRRNDIITSIHNYPLIECLLFSLAELAITIVATIIINREYYVIRSMNQQYNNMFKEFGICRVPECNSGHNIITKMKLSTGNMLCYSCTILGFLSIFIILFIALFLE